MTHRRLIATGVVAAAGLALAGSAHAAPDVQGVEVTRISSKQVEVLVEALRGYPAVQPHVHVTVARHTSRARVREWNPPRAADDTTVGAVGVSRVRTTVGPR